MLLALPSILKEIIPASLSSSKYLTKHKSYIKEIATSLLKNETILYSEIKNILPDTLEDSSEILCL